MGGIATTTTTAPLPSNSPLTTLIQLTHNNNNNNPMSQDYHHQGIFTFSNGFDRSPQQEQQHHIAQQIRRDKLRVQGFDPPPPLGPLDHEPHASTLQPYETAGMLSEMFNFPSGVNTATELLENHLPPPYRSPRPTTTGPDWYGNREGMMGPLGDPKNHHHQDQDHHQHQISGINADSAAAMQLFLMNPQPRSPSPSSSSHHHHHPPSTLHMLLPTPPSSTTLQGGAFGQFTWGPSTEIGGVVEGQGLSLSLSSSLQHLEVAKAEELRMGDDGMMFYNQGGGVNTTAYNQYKNYGGVVGQSQQQVHHVGYGGANSMGVVNVLRNSKYAKAAQELLEEFCSVGRGQLKKNKFGRVSSTNPNTTSQTSSGGGGGGGGGGSSSSLKDLPPPLSAADRIEHQRRKVKLLSMLDEVDRRFNHYCEQMQMVVNSFDLVMGFGAAVPYTALAQKAMSRHFRCLKDAISAQLKHSCELLGEKDAGTSGVTKGETPRLKLLEQSLRQQRAFHQMGMMEQEAWRPQRGLPERSVNILRAWLFEHFLHPYPSDADKHLLARQTGLSRNQDKVKAKQKELKQNATENSDQSTSLACDALSHVFGNDTRGRTRGVGSTVSRSSIEASLPAISLLEIERAEGKEVSNWFINARVRLWKPMVEEMYQKESKEDTTTEEDQEKEERENNNSDPAPSTATAQTPKPPPISTASTSTTSTPTAATTTIRSHINYPENDPSLLAINTQCFSENQAKHGSHSLPHPYTAAPPAMPPVSQPFPTAYEADMCRRSGFVGNDYGTTNPMNNSDVGSTLIRFGTTAGDVSLTLGLRHAGNLPDKGNFSVRDFGGC